MNDNNIEQLDWLEREIVYQCRFGEFPIFTLKFSGFKATPNIFEVSTQDLLPAPGKPKAISFAYSLPCNNSIQPRVTFNKDHITHVEFVYRHFYVDTSGDFNEYMKRFKGKSLNSLKRKIKKVENSNKKISFIEFSKASEVESFLSIAKLVSEKSYQEKLLGRLLPTDCEFAKKIKELAERDSFRGYILYVEDQPAAYNLCPIYGKGILLYDFTGYDPSYNKYSVGTVLQYKIIEQAFATPEINIYDLCTGEGRHKEIFATDYKTCCDVYYFPKTIYYCLIIYTRFGIEKISNLFKSLLEKMGLKERIKKLIRRL